MNAKEYQDLAARTLIENPGEFTHQEIMTIWSGMGLAGEAGEAADCIKKGIFHRHGLDREKLIKELGDVCWYLAAVCTVQGIDLGDVMQANIDKLKTRYPDGFSTADSVKRVDVENPIAAEMCKCGHFDYAHAQGGRCYRSVNGAFCSCEKYTPIPVLLHGEQLGLFEEHQNYWKCPCGNLNFSTIEKCDCGQSKVTLRNIYPDK